MYKVIGILFCMVLLASCEAESPTLNADDSIVYLSNYEKEIDFKSYKTFYLADSVFIIDQNKMRISKDIKKQIFVQQFRKRLENLGYIEVKQKELADMGVMVGAIQFSLIGKDAPINTYYLDYWNKPNLNAAVTKTPGNADKYDFSQREVVWSSYIFDLKNAEKNKGLRIIWNPQIWGSFQILNNDQNYTQFCETLFNISKFLK